MLTRRTLATASAALAATSLAHRARAQAAAPIRIGYQLPLSGAAAAIGLQTRAAAEVAAEHINNNGGVNGRRIELVFADDKTNPNEGVAGARELMGSGINLLATGFLTFDLFGAMPIIQQTNTVAVSMAGVLMSITHEKFDRHVFRQNTNDFQALTAAARLAVQRYPDIKIWSAIAIDGGSTRDSAFNFLTAVKNEYAKSGREITTFPPQLVKNGATDYKNEIAALRAQGVQGLLSEVFGAGGVTLYEQARTLGLTQQLKTVIDIGNDYAFAKAIGKNIPSNFWAYSHWNPAIYPNSKLSQSIASAWSARTNDPYPPTFVYYGSTPVFIFAAAIKAAGGATDSDTIIRTLESGIQIETIQGSWSFRKEDHQAQCDLSFVRFDPIDARPGFAVTDHVTYKGTDLLEPPSPGVEFKF